MQRLLCLLLLLCFWCFSVSAGIILDDGLLLQGGAEEIVMRSGEKVYLRAQNSIWGYSVLQGLEYSSKHPSVAYVDRYGWIHAMLPGRTVISVWNDEGDNGTITVLVEGNSKMSGIGWIAILLFLALIGFICLQLRFRRFE